MRTMICFFLIGRFLELFLAAFFIAWIPVGLLDHVKAKRSLVDKMCRAQAVALFVRRFRCEWGNEFLETRVTPKRIENRIEPEQRGSQRHVFRQWTCIRYRE